MTSGPCQRLCCSAACDIINVNSKQQAGSDRRGLIIAYWAVAQHIGNVQVTNKYGHLIGHVKNHGRDPKDPLTRLYSTNAAQPFHCDRGADIIGLCCVHQAKSGGTLVFWWPQKAPVTRFEVATCYELVHDGVTGDTLSFMLGLAISAWAVLAGLSSWASSAAVYNELLKKRPDVIQVQ